MTKFTTLFFSALSL